MNKNDRNLILAFLGELAERFGDDGCNDWCWPTTWSESYKRDFLNRYNDWARKNGEEVDFMTKYGPDNTSLVYFLMDLFKKEVK